MCLRRHSGRGRSQRSLRWDQLRSWRPCFPVFRPWALRCCRRSRLRRSGSSMRHACATRVNQSSSLQVCALFAPAGFVEARHSPHAKKFVLDAETSPTAAGARHDGEPVWKLAARMEARSVGAAVDACLGKPRRSELGDRPGSSGTGDRPGSSGTGAPRARPGTLLEKVPHADK